MADDVMLLFFPVHTLAAHYKPYSDDEVGENGRVKLQKILSTGRNHYN